MKQIAIYGAGGFGRELVWLAEACGKMQGGYDVVCFIDDNVKHHGKLINEIPVMGIDKARLQFPNAVLVGAAGQPKIRQAMMDKSASAGFEFETLIHPNVGRSRWIDMGKGVVICSGSILTTNIVLGNHVQINLHCTIGHDVILDDYVTLAPGVHVSGYVRMGKRVYVGTGAVFVNGTQEEPVVIGDDVIIGAGACVTKSIQSGVWGGVPARNLKEKTSL